jgi:diguanylate cyclase (GGDEF)-like protein/putative nucleotidyltransferase with HDIG domain
MEPANPVPADRIRVLVIDDEEPIRSLARRILIQAGCTVEAAADGRDGLQLLLGSDFDVAVVDLKMSRMDGISFLVEALRICPWIGVVIVTGLSQQVDVDRARELGVKHILKKPFRVDEFRGMVFEQAEEKRRKLTTSSDISLGRIQNALGLFRQLTCAATESDTLLDALQSLSTGLQILPSAVVAILSLEEDPILVISVLKPVSREFLQTFEDEIRMRYQRFSGQTLSSELRIEVQGVAESEDAAAAVGNSFSIPIITGGDISGLLAHASIDKDAYSETDMLFMYHAANLLSTVLLTFRRMKQLAVRDALTGLYNQRGLREQMESVWQMVKRYHYRVSIAVLDIDQFKAVNDTYGHPVGDEVLVELGDLLRVSVRASDIIGRYGGDEFVILFPNASPEDLAAFSERFMETLRGHIFCDGTHDLKLTVSMGMSSSFGQDWLLLSSNEILTQADQALYTAKDNGRDQVCMWSAGGFAATETIETLTPVARETAKHEIQGAGRLLVVDDEEVVLDYLRTVLKTEGYEVVAVQSAEEAREALRSAPGEIGIVVTDITLKEESGLDLLKDLRSLDDMLVAIVMTGNVTLDNAVSSLRHGAYDFIEKPIEVAPLLAVLNRAREYRRLRLQNRRYQLRLEDMVREKSKELSIALEQAKQSYNFTLEALVAMIDAREQNTGRHSVNVRELSLILGRELDLGERDMRILSQGALLHDIGKIAIPDSILLKEGPLTSDEWVVMRSHAEKGYEIVSRSPFLKESAEIVHSHQEKYDGTGYPRGLAGDDICMGARIFSVVDAYDAMRTDRPYRKAMRTSDAINELRTYSGTQFDPTVVEAALRCIDQMERVRALTTDIESIEVAAP